ncbi:S8 family serine peptidase [Streptomyces sp. NPDC055400]
MSQTDRAGRRATPVGRSRRQLACLVVVGVVGAGLTLAPNAGAEDGPKPLPIVKGAKAPATARTLTLVTGDKLQVTTNTKGELNAVELPQPGQPEPTLDVTRTTDGDLHVTPESAVPLIAAGRLDPDLFDVTKLLKYGYDDSKTDHIPLIATYNKKTKSLIAPKGVQKVRTLSGLHTTTFSTQKSKADDVWEDVQGTGATLADGMTKLWLDAPAKVADVDWNLSQIEAPDAWGKGLDGKDVPVAVLDTGVDSTHPDLAGRIKETKNFTSEADGVDHNGHGTHVAATIAGSGGASDGAHKGVAPGAELHIGKVLGADGTGVDSQVLAGMDWAAHSGAKIVSMSLGGQFASDGTDVLSQTVNQLSEETGTLFVIAAGNTGDKGTSTVAAPGAAADALTIGAVDSAGKIARFSSRGPLINNGAVKPDVTAPGVDIISARAAGTAMGTPVDDLYTKASGTSMATPHVAGAAAIVAQAHPDWTGQQIKAALVGSAEPGQEDGFTDGSGEIRVSRAAEAKVLAEPANLNFHFVPPSGTEKATHEITYTNTADNPVTVNLKADFSRSGTPAPEGAFTFTDTSITVPAGGSAAATLVVDPAKVETGTYGGLVTATADGGSTVRTPASVSKDLPRTKISLPLTAHDGSSHAIGGQIVLWGEDKGAPNLPTTISVTPGQTSEISVPSGKYTIVGRLTRTNSAGTIIERYFLGSTGVAVTGDTMTFPLDGSKARKSELRGEKPAEVRYREFGWQRQADTPPGFRYIDTRQLIPDKCHEDFYVGAMKANGGAFQWSHRAVSYHEDVDARVVNGAVIDAVPVGRAGTTAARGEHHYRVVPVGKATAAELAGKDLDGAIALVDHVPGTSYSRQTTDLKAAGAAAALLAGPNGELFADPNFLSVLPAYTITKTTADRLRKPRTEVDIDYDPDSPYMYDLVTGGTDTGTDPVSVKADDAKLARVDADYHSPNGASTLVGVYRTATWGAVLDGLAHVEPVMLPHKRTEYYTPDPNVSWSRSLYPRDTGSLPSLAPAFTTPGGVFTPGSTRHEDWLKPGIAPYVGNGVVSWYDATRLRINARTWGDSSGIHGKFLESGADVVSTSWYRNGELVGSAPDFERLGLPVEADPADYRLDVDAKRENQPGWGYSTHVSTSWSFRTAQRQAAPNLPAPRYDIPTDGYGKVRGDHSMTLTLATGTNPKSAKVSFSYDGGTSWKDASVSRRADGTWSVTVQLPKADAVKDGKVSMRLEAANTAGDTVTQTITNAFGVK